MQLKLGELANSRDEGEEFIIRKAFKFKSKLTERTIDVSKAFGVGIDERELNVVQVSVRIRRGDVIYVHGESGSGKTVFIRELAKEMERRGWGKICLMRGFEELNISGAIIDNVGKDTEDAISKLSMVGLSEAFIFLRHYNELSDGQKYRFRLAKMLDKECDVIIADEFCSVLDRTTAKVVAYLFQKVCRKTGKTLIASTAHDDLAYDLNPDIDIYFRFGEATIKYNEYQKRRCSIYQEGLNIRRITKREAEQLEKFHYRGAIPGFITDMFGLFLNGQMIGMIIYTLPYLYIRARKEALPDCEILLKEKTFTKEAEKFVNNNFRRIARVVILPKFRGIGLGAYLVKETMPMVDKPYIETLAVMARYNPFFERAGMTKIGVASFKEGRRHVLNTLTKLGLEPEKCISAEYIKEKWAGMDEKRRLRLLRTINANRSFFNMKKKVREYEFDLMAEVIRGLLGEPLYFLWKNPKYKDLPDIKVK